MAESLMGLGWWLLVAVVVAILGVGRWVRLVTYDSFPPAMWVRQTWAAITERREWSAKWTDLLFCPWCFTPWLMLVCGGWFLLTLSTPWLAWAWWILWGWGALSYVTSMVIVRDEPKE